jgi:hypothetical protein
MGSETAAPAPSGWDIESIDGIAAEADADRERAGAPPRVTSTRATARPAAADGASVQDALHCRRAPRRTGISMSW